MSFKSARIKAGKKVSEVVEFMKVSDAAIYYWETGVNLPTADKLKKLADFYGCTIDDLLRDDEQK